MSLQEVSDFIDAQKNFIMTLIAVLVGFYCTVARYHLSTAGSGLGWQLQPWASIRGIGLRPGRCKHERVSYQSRR